MIKRNKFGSTVGDANKEELIADIQRQHQEVMRKRIYDTTTLSEIDFENNIKGWIIKVYNEMIFISRNDKFYKEKLINYLNAGGQIIYYAIECEEYKRISGYTETYNEEKVLKRSRSKNT